nr:MAG TPA: hypothetical protein [Caudoviricetes sp.]
MASCHTISIYGGRRVSNVHRNEFICTLIGFQSGFFISVLKIKYQYV